MTPTIYYCYDAYCGWCYGFSPVMKAFAEAVAGRAECKAVSGGMMLGEREGPIGIVAPYIKTAYKQVESTTGVKFGQAFLTKILQDGKTLLSSLPPALAMAVFRESFPGRTIEFAAALQEAIYKDGMAPAIIENYGMPAAEFGLDGLDFVRRMQTPDAKRAARAEFAFTAEMGITGFPAVVLIQGKKGYLLAKGYTPAEQLMQRFENVMNELQTDGES